MKNYAQNKKNPIAYTLSLWNVGALVVWMWLAAWDWTDRHEFTHLLEFEPWMGGCGHVHAWINYNFSSSFLFFLFFFLGDFSVSHVRERWVRKTNFAKGSCKYNFFFFFLTVEWQLPSFASIGQTDLCNQIQVPKEDSTWKPLILRPGSKRDLLNPAKNRPTKNLYTTTIYF